MTGTALVLMALLVTGAERESASGFADLERAYALAQGERIRVTDRDGQSTRGEFRGFAGDRIQVEVDGAVRELAEESVRTIRVRRPDPVWDGALVGILASSPLIFLNLALSDTSSAGSVVPQIMLGALLWGAVGAGIDALIVGERTVYRDGPGGAAVSRLRARVCPIAVAAGGGVAVQLRF
jgi:hypothetical protein